MKQSECFCTCRISFWNKNCLWLRGVHWAQPLRSLNFSWVRNDQVNSMTLCSAIPGRCHDVITFTLSETYWLVEMYDAHCFRVQNRFELVFLNSASAMFNSSCTRGWCIWSWWVWVSAPDFLEGQEFVTSKKKKSFLPPPPPPPQEKPFMLKPPSGEIAHSSAMWVAPLVSGINVFIKGINKVFLQVEFG